MEQLKKQIKKGTLDKVYLFYGEENFLKNEYLNLIKEKLINKQWEDMNVTIFENKEIDSDKIESSIYTLPFMSEKRLVLIKNINLFTEKKDYVDKLAECLENIPDTTCLIISEQEIDKRSKIYKKIKEKGRVIEFNKLKEEQLIKWLQQEFSKENKQIENKTALYMIRFVGTNMDTLYQEIKKIVAYVNKNDNIEQNDLENVCVKSVEAKIFDLVKFIGTKQIKKALECYQDLLFLKEQPISILMMIARQFRIMLKSKYLQEEGYDINSIAGLLEEQPFVVRDGISQSNNFSKQTLKQAMESCLETDVAIKTGKIEPKRGVEMLIIQYAQ